MATVVRMPQLAAGGADAAIQAWLVGVGDAVAAGQTIVEIETEKAVVEYEAEAAGTLAGILVATGDSAAVGAPIAVLADAGQSADDALREAGAQTGGAVAAASGAFSPAVLATTPNAPAHPAAPAPVTDAPVRRLFASPLVRRLANERGLDLADIAGSGPNGRIVRRDLDALATPVQPQARLGSDPGALAAPDAARGYSDVPHTGMRRAIARRLTESTTTVPHFFLTAHCRVDELLALREQINTRTGHRVSVNDLVVKAVGGALRDVPEANAIWTDDAVRRFDHADVAIAVSVRDGLVTPVVRGVDSLSLGELSPVVRDLAERARAGRIRQHELEGGSFSVSNLGMYGTEEFSAIINPPHSGILAVGAATKRPVVNGDGQLDVATVMTVTLSADHRVLDGALAARWLAAFVARIESPIGILL